MFGSIDIKARPLKIAFLVEPDKVKQTREAIRISSSLWGGDYFPIIPLYKRMPSTWREPPLRTPSASSVIHGYIEAFDPDIFVQFSKEIPKFIDNLGIEIVKPDAIWQGLDGVENLAPKYGIGIFEILNDIFSKEFKFLTKYPMEIIFPKIPKKFSLFWTSWFGEMPLAVSPLIDRYYSKPLEIKVPAFKVEDIKSIMARRVIFPRRITHHGINRYRRSGFRREAYVYYLDATKPQDVIDFWNLRAMGKSVMPVPKQLQNNPQIRELVIEFLKAHRRPWKHEPKVCDIAMILRARNCTPEELEEYTKTLKIDPDPNDASDNPFFIPQNMYPRVWDEWARDKDGAVPDDIYGVEEKSVELTDSQSSRVTFKSILPKFAKIYGYSGEPRCVNEVSFRIYGGMEFIAEALPKSSGENYIRAISGLTSFRGDWRVGRNGLVKIVKDNYNETREIPLAEDLFFAWLKDLGWKVELSSAGLLAKQIQRMLDGNIEILANKNLLGLFEHMNGGNVKLNGEPTVKKGINEEKALNVNIVKNKLANRTPGYDLHEFLVKKGIFRIGLQIKCPRCSRYSWYSLDSVRESLSCPLCLFDFAAAGVIDKSQWYYKTAGPFSIPRYADGAYTVLLTADFFGDRKMHSLRISPVFSFIGKKTGDMEMEADIGAFWQDSGFGEFCEGILFGECKTYNKFEEKDFERMRYLAKSFPGAVLVFSTLRKLLDEDEIAEIAKIAREGREYWKAERPINPVLILTGNELLNEFGPPHCWEESLKKKFDRLHGMIELCNVTQQIYLKLPPWEEEWREEWKKKYKKRAKKKNRK